MIPQFCTWFDHRYLPRGLAMMRSVRRFHPEAAFVVLCLSPEVEAELRRLKLPWVTTLTIEELVSAFPELRGCREDRSLVEFYFTCSPFLPLFLLTRLGAPRATLMDADLWFFSGMAPLFEEIAGASIAIIPHRFPKGFEHLEMYGRFNVGWQSFTNDAVGLNCLRWWGQRCVEWCRDEPADGKFADQKYLDSFPELFGDHLCIIRHPGANLAPWNLPGHEVTRQNGRVLVDGRPLIFFHFHSFGFPNRWAVSVPFHYYGIPPSPLLKKEILAPYFRELAACGQEFGGGKLIRRGEAGKQAAAKERLPHGWREWRAAAREGRYVFRALGREERQERRRLKQAEQEERKRQQKMAAPRVEVAIEGAPSSAKAPPPPDMLRFDGDYSNWKEACAASAGYDSPHIFEKTREAILKIASGEAVFERDSVLFDEPQYPFSTIASLLHAACARREGFTVLDFGGSLGSSYFACRPWLDSIPQLKWQVVEQPHYVACGRSELQGERLRFHRTIAEAVSESPPTAILLSSVLQYLSDPGAVLKELLGLGAPYLILDRTPFWDGPRHRIVVQRVPAEIYAASYPAWLFCEAELCRVIEARDYRLIATWPGFDVIPLPGGRSFFKGSLFRRSTNSGGATGATTRLFRHHGKYI